MTRCNGHECVNEARYVVQAAHGIPACREHLGSTVAIVMEFEGEAKVKFAGKRTWVD